MPQTDSIPRGQLWVRRVNRWVYWFIEHWMAGFSILFGLFVGMPFLAPFLVTLDPQFPAKIIYSIYSFLCHQLPQRSCYLFGNLLSYSLVDINPVWPNISGFQIFRQYIGATEMG